MIIIFSPFFSPYFREDSKVYGPTVFILSCTDTGQQHQEKKRLEFLSRNLSHTIE